MASSSSLSLRSSFFPHPSSSSTSSILPHPPQDPGTSSMAGTTRSVLRSTEPVWKEAFNFELGQGVKPSQLLKAQVVKSGERGSSATGSLSPRPGLWALPT
eukprot:1688408-Rhodomonas_salina.1